MQIELRNEELGVLRTQLSCRLDFFDEEIKEAAKNNNFDRVEEVVAYKKIIKGIIDKTW